MNEVFKARRSKIIGLLISPLGSVAALYITYSSTGKLSISLAFILLLASAPFVFFGLRLRSTPFLVINGENIKFNNFLTGQSTNFTMSQVTKVSIEGGAFAISTPSQAEPARIAIRMLSSKDKERLKEIFKIN